MDWTKHLFSPLISFEGDYGIKISPVQLNADEMIFVEDLKKYYEENTSFFNGKALYLLRNQSKGKGVGFFQEAGFFPDFILWLIKDNKQYITFIDPKRTGFIIFNTLAQKILSFSCKNETKIKEDNTIFYDFLKEELDGFFSLVRNFTDKNNYLCISCRIINFSLGKCS